MRADSGLKRFMWTDSDLRDPGLSRVHLLHLPQQVILPTSTQCDTLLYRAKGPTILNSQIP